MQTSRAVVIAVGDEIVLGQQIDTNSAHISSRLAEMGVTTARHVTVPDDQDAIARAIADAIDEADLIIVTGGLGPTKDDLTRAALADVLGCPLVQDDRATDDISTYFKAMDRTPPESVFVQALRPATARMLANNHGTAPGLHARIAYDGIPAGSADVFCFPGPPRELNPMFETYVAATLLERATIPSIAQRVIRTFGLGESAVADRLGDLMTRTNDVLVGTTASQGIVSIRIRSQSQTPMTTREAEQSVEDTAAKVYGLLSPVIYGENDDTLAHAVVKLLRDRGETLTIAESCTGGLVGAAITSVSGASSVFDASLVTYSNAAKGAVLDVSEATLERYGAVSGVCAQEMVAGALEISGATHAIAITGIAGPTGGTPDKPVGTVWIAVDADSYEIDARRFLFKGHREEIRAHAVNAALGLLRLHLTGNDRETLLWQAERL